MPYRIGPPGIIVVPGLLFAYVYVYIYIYIYTGTEVDLGAIVLFSIRAGRRADPAYGWSMRSMGEAQPAMRRMLGFVSISERVSAVGAPIRFYSPAVYGGSTSRAFSSGNRARTTV